jgi:hypothetical protein
MCDVMMDQDELIFLQKLLTVKNLISSVSCWPIWIANHYCSLYQSDSHKFAALLLITEHDELWEMVVVRNRNCMYYRSGNINVFNKAKETEDTLQYISRILKINPNNVMIYTIAKEAILNLTEASTARMSCVSRGVKISIAHYVREIDKVIKFGSYLIIAISAICSVINAFNIVNYNEKLTKAHETIASIDKKIINEACMWKSIESIGYGNILDFREMLLQRVQESKVLRNASITMGESVDDVKINVIPEE